MVGTSTSRILRGKPPYTWLLRDSYQMLQNSRIFIEIGTDINTEHSYERTALHYAIMGRLDSVLKPLVNMVATSTHRMPARCTALHFAVDSQLPDVAILLINLGADINAKTADGRAGLHFAANGPLSSSFRSGVLPDVLWTAE